MAERFLIGPDKNSGLQTNLKSWKIHDNAYTVCENMYVFRGRTRKRFGSRYTGFPLTAAEAPLFSQAAIKVGTTNNVGNLSGTAFGKIFAVGQKFSIGDEVFTVFNPAAGANPMLDSTGLAATKTFNLTNGAFVFAGAAALTDISFYPGEPILGQSLYEFGPINNQNAHAIDTQTGYVFNGTRWVQSGTTIHLTLRNPDGKKDNYSWLFNADAFEQTNTMPLMFLSNFQITNPNGNGVFTDDPIWYFNGTDWIFFSYQPDAAINTGNNQPQTVTRTRKGAPTIITNYVQSARIIVFFKGRLLLMNTIENNNNEVNGAGATTPITPANYLTSTNSNFAQRVRFSHNGDPTKIFKANAWLEPNMSYNNGILPVANADGAGYIDADTEEQIVSAEFIKDRLIVYFERSTWEIVDTGNPVKPLKFQKINTELGSESTFSTVPFDKMILNIGSQGVMGCTGANIERIDEFIPDQVFQIEQFNQGIQRVYGIRDYKTEMVYWTYPDITVRNGDKSYQFPNQILVYNYKNGSWGINDDVITSFGYFEQQTQNLTWAQMTMQWQEAAAAWNSGVFNALPRKVLAGNQQGFLYTIEPDETYNEATMIITNMTPAGQIVQIINHQLNLGDFIYINTPNGITIPSQFPGSNIVKVTNIIDADNIVIDNFAAPFFGTYIGGGYAGRVSNVNLVTKLFNPYDEQAMNIAINKIDFLVDKTGEPNVGGELTIDYYVSSNTSLQMLNQAMDTNTIVASGVLQTSPYLLPEYGMENGAERLWRTAYIQAFGNGIQLNIYMSDQQMIDPVIAWADIQIHAYILNITRAGRLV